MAQGLDLPFVPHFIIGDRAPIALGPATVVGGVGLLAGADDRGRAALAALVGQPSSASVFGGMTGFTPAAPLSPPRVPTKALMRSIGSGKMMVRL